MICRMVRVGRKTKDAGPFQVGLERGPDDDLIELDSDSSNRCAGIGIHIIEGDKTVKATRCTNINERISTSFLEGLVNGFFEIGIAKRNDRQDKVSTGLPLCQT